MSNASEASSGGFSPADSGNGADDTFVAAAQAVDDAVAATRSWPADQAEAARELQRAIEAFHTPVLEKFVRAMRANDAANTVLFELVDDPHVRALLTMHGIIRPPGPAVAEPVVSTTIIPIESIKVRNRPAEIRPSDQPPIDPSGGWIAGPLVSDVAVDDTHRLDTTIDGELVFVLFTNVGGAISAFRNACVHQGLTLDGARVIDGIITCPWHGFAFDAVSGECISAPGAQLERYESRVVDGTVWFKP